MVQRFATGPGEPERRRKPSSRSVVISRPFVCRWSRAGNLHGRRRPATRRDHGRASRSRDLAGTIGDRSAALAAIGDRAPRRWRSSASPAMRRHRDCATPDFHKLRVTYASKSYSGLDLVVRGPNPASFIGPVKEVVQRLGAGRPVSDVRLLEDYVPLPQPTRASPSSSEALSRCWPWR